MENIPPAALLLIIAFQEKGLYINPLTRRHLKIFKQFLWINLLFRVVQNFRVK
jgi:hypothetical protein